MLEHFENLALRHLPGDWQTEIAVTRPNLDSAVFVSVKEDVGDVEILKSGDSVHLERGSQHMLQYSTVSHLLDGECVKLI